MNCPVYIAAFLAGETACTPSGAKLYVFSVPGGPSVPASSVSPGFLVETDSFALSDVGELSWWATLPDQSASPNQFIATVTAEAPVSVGATASLRVCVANLDPTNAPNTGAFRLVVAVYPIAASPGNIVPP